jgi:hypothetical protein
MINSFNSDEDFLLWIANRLVYRYKENSTIIDRVKFIIEKNKIIRNVLDNSNISMTRAITETIKYLDLVKEKNQVEIKSLSSKFKDIKIDNNIIDLENIDMDYLLKGVSKK